MKIAIVGNGILTRNDVPEGWAKWGHSHCVYMNGQSGFDRLYEVHNYDWDDDYCSWMARNEVYTRADVPLENIFSLVSPDGFDSSVAMMIACAILECPDEIGVWGVDARVMDKQEYSIQWPNIMWVLGIARGLGIKISAPTRSGLFTKGHYGD